MTNSDLVVTKSDIASKEFFTQWFNSGYTNDQLRNKIIKSTFYDDYGDIHEYGRIALCIILSRFDLPDHCK